MHRERPDAEKEHQAAKETEKQCPRATVSSLTITLTAAALPVTYEMPVSSVTSPLPSTPLGGPAQGSLLCPTEFISI